MKFRTEIHIPESDFKITHNTRGITLGSCFTTYIGNKLHESKFKILVNPLGTVYNPVSILQTVQLLQGTKNIDQSAVINEHGVWQSYMLHSSFSATEKEQLLHNFAQIQQQYTTDFSTADYCILSLGTSWVYALQSTEEIVNNCHKSPASMFTRKRLSHTEIYQTIDATCKALRKNNPTMHIVFTISPIRHWKDGAYENQVSKAALFMAVDEILQQVKNTAYFPAYEILIDDLRDYRFYEQDMLHPNAQAVEYIWGKFVSTYIPTHTIELCKNIEQIQKAILHRPYNKTTEYLQFIQKALYQCHEITTKGVDMSEEISKLKSKQ